MTCTSGFTLLELLTCLAVVTVLTSLTAPTLSYYIKKQSIITQMHGIRQTLATTRGLAVTLGEKISVCGIDENNQCTRKKISQFVIYKDSNKNTRLDENDTTLEYYKLGKHTNIFMRLALSRESLTFDSKGFADYNGGIVVCPLKKDPTLIRKLTVSGAGRIYSAPDRNGDGHIETIKGKAVNC